MIILTWHQLLAGDSRILSFSEDDKSGCPWVYATCKNPLAAWLLLRHLQRQSYGYISRRDWGSVWLGPAEWRPTPLSGREATAPRPWWQRLMPHRAAFWQCHRRRG